MTSLQTELLRKLLQTVKRLGDRRIIYHTEYLGYLPYGQYHWILIAGQYIYSFRFRSIGSETTLMLW